ncbi:MAG: hypothetical protein A2750_01850 [Candidatus Yanofskybacteria bacterium RIFCSPHIGHO2_01_FULL_45_42]|nr:MAG: hypothetical protein A2750_01850 [Candidatus Yanofskybacteria bacterium RIFCSPHIGHO2_01_FULL_45_42]OGN32194.1 MAG: hypothetical protein A3J01_01225 [Candidatus Yanofskybacteria bacterium RIFCSPLOWO2_02_FULL_45_18]
MRTLTSLESVYSVFYQFYVPKGTPLAGKNIKRLQDRFGIKIKIYNSVRRCWSRTILEGEPMILVGDSRRVTLFKNKLFKFIPR